MADRVKGITVEIGGDTTGLSKALSGVNKEINKTQRDLKDVERLLKMDPGNTELLRQKYDLLNKSIDATDQKLGTLKEAERQVQEQFERGEISEDQYNALKREIIATEASLKELRKEAKQTEETINRIDDDNIEDVEDSAEDAGDELEKAGKKAAGFADALKAEVIVEGAKAIVSSLRDIAEETKEYQKIMGSLKISSEKAGYTAEETAQTYKKLYGVLADDQTAATTTANLQALGASQENLNMMVDAAIGAWATYGDSIPIDGLAEAINETVKVGTVTGTFADVLNWAGESEEEFNERLSRCVDEADRTNVILQMLARQGLVESGRGWREQNAALVESNEAQADMQEQLSQLGEMILPIMTDITEKVVELLAWFNGLDESTQEIILIMIALTAAIGPTISAINGISAAISFLVANPIVLLVAAIIGLVALIAVKGDEIQQMLEKLDDFLQNIFAQDWTTVFGPILGGVINGFLANVKNMWDSAKMIFSGIIDFIRGVFSGDWDRAWNGIVKIFEGIFSGLAARVKIPINGVISVINLAIDAVNTLINGLNKVPWVNVKSVGKIPFLADGGVVSQGSAVVGEAGPELLTMMGGRAVVQPLTNQTTTHHTELGGMTLNIYGAPGQDVRELAKIIESEIGSAINRKEAYAL